MIGKKKGVGVGVPVQLVHNVIVIIQLYLFFIIVLTLNPLHFSAWLVQVRVHVCIFSKTGVVRHTPVSCFVVYLNIKKKRSCSTVVVVVENKNPIELMNTNLKARNRDFETQAVISWPKYKCRFSCRHHSLLERRVSFFSFFTVSLCILFCLPTNILRQKINCWGCGQLQSASSFVRDQSRPSHFFYLGTLDFFDGSFLFVILMGIIKLTLRTCRAFPSPVP